MTVVRPTQTMALQIICDFVVLYSAFVASMPLRARVGMPLAS